MNILTTILHDILLGAAIIVFVAIVVGIISVTSSSLEIPTWMSFPHLRPSRSMDEEPDTSEA